MLGNDLATNHGMMITNAPYYTTGARPCPQPNHDRISVSDEAFTSP
jgi:hypothetical protein